MSSQAGAASASATPSEGYGFGPFTLDIGSRKLRREREEIALPSRAFDTLALLVRHRDRIVEKDEIIKAVWAGTVVFCRDLIPCVSLVRPVLQDDGEHPRFIATHSRRGYRFVGEVARLSFASAS